MTLLPRTEEIRLRAKAELAARRKLAAQRLATDVVDWGHSKYYVVDEETKTVSLVSLALVQQAVLRYAMQRDELGHWRFSTVLLSTVKKSGKTTLASIIAGWVAETQTRRGEIYFAGNDLDQAKERAFGALAGSISLTPGASQQSGGEWVIPGRWRAQKTIIESLTSGTRLKAIAVDARGEAGSNPDLTVWTELWGFTLPDAVRFYNEMTPVPTKDSMRVVETYAGFEGESKLLEDLYDLGKGGRQLTNGELAAAVARPDVPGQTYEDYLYAWAELDGDPDALVPCWVSEAAGLFTWWDEGLTARRMPWLQGERGRRYYAEQAIMLPANEYDRLHLNQWSGRQSGFIPIEWWDDCYDEDLPELLPGDPTPTVLGVDAAVTNDCFGVVLVSRYPTPALHDHVVALQGARLWRPQDTGGRIDLSAPEAFIRALAKGGCTLAAHGSPQPDCPACTEGRIVAPYNLKQVAYDPYQLEGMMQRLAKERVVWCEPFHQGQPRAEADSALRLAIIERRIRHRCPPPGHPQYDPDHPLLVVRQHLLNAGAQLQKSEDSKLRMVKRTPDRKIDLAVALSMAVARCLYLRL